MESIETQAIQNKIDEGNVNFNKIKEEIAQIEIKESQLKNRKAELNVELFRIQGEHRVLKDLLTVKDEPIDQPNN